jgi:hypothetical protein
VFLLTRLGQRREPEQFHGSPAGTSGRDHQELGRQLHENRDENDQRFGTKNYNVHDHQPHQRLHQRRTSSPHLRERRPGL